MVALINAIMLMSLSQPSIPMAPSTIDDGNTIDDVSMADP
jgi:hypothetical protein